MDTKNPRIMSRLFRGHVRWLLVAYDAAVYLASCFLMLIVYHSGALQSRQLLLIVPTGWALLFLCRYLLGIYHQVWRYGGIRSYLLLILADALAFLTQFLLDKAIGDKLLSFALALATTCIDLLGAITVRMLYACAYKASGQDTRFGRFLVYLMKYSGASEAISREGTCKRGIPVAIVGAGRVGVALAEELMNNTASVFQPRFFVDTNKSKIGREIYGLPVYPDGAVTPELVNAMGIQEIIFALPQLNAAQRKEIYESYRNLGCRLKTYDFPLMETAGRRSVRDFDIEDLLFRRSVDMDFRKTASYYRNKVILVTGGGGSIGSELCRQLSEMQPKRLVVLDVAENGAYDLQQELRIAFEGRLDVVPEICSICDKAALRRVFAEHRPQVVIMAAAHKHVPLMEKNCIEAITNNIFGTLNTVEVSEEFQVERVIMVSTDKAVNPTNVMGATKRMCEMIVRSHAEKADKTTFSMTRFGNVLGSAGSVIPLFKKQIACGGPVTITDRRIIRYFMTIPEASQLVLQSGAMAKNGELFVLDMGHPVKILDLAQNMIRLSGASDIEIVEVGLRPGEKLYEELLVQTEHLERTENDLIFIEKDEPQTADAIREKLALLRQACESGSDEAARVALMQAVPTFHRPEEVNTAADPLRETEKCIAEADAKIPAAARS